MLDKPTSNQTYASRYIARVDDHLPTLPDNATRRAFLLAERQKFEDDFNYFQIHGKSGFTLSGAQPDVSDYTLTITGLTSRLEKIGEATP